MRKYILPAAVVAAISLLAVGAYQIMTTPRVPEITFRAQVRPKLLLPDSKTHECRRERVEDDQGGAVDSVDMDNGYTKEMHFLVLPYVHKEYTFYPASPKITSCETFAAADAGGRGPLFKESIRTADGKRPVSEVQWSRDHKLIAEGKLLDDPNKFETRFFNETGLVKASEIFDLLRNRKESESYYRDDGTKKQTKFLTFGADYFANYFYADDGVTVLWKDDRSFGSYTIVELYPDGKTPRLEAKRLPYNTVLTDYRADGKKERLIRVMDNTFIDVILYDKEGKAFLMQRWKTKRVGNKDVVDAAGKPVKVLDTVSLVDEKENPSRIYNFDDAGALKTVTEVPTHKLWAEHTEYTVDATGLAVSKKVWNDKGNYVGEFTIDATSNPLRFALRREQTTMPSWRIPEKLSQYDDKVNLEQPREH